MNPVTPEIPTQPQPVKIVPAGEAHASLLALLTRQAYADVAQRFGLSARNAPTHPSVCTVGWVRSDMQAGVRYFLAARGDMYIGCAALKQATRKVFYLMRLAVLPLFRGGGVGRRLAEHTCRQAGQAGASLVSIGLIADQEELVAWYCRLGFTVFDRRRYAHLPFEVLLMRRHLVLTDSRSSPAQKPRLSGAQVEE